ncbi:hypothetical protein BOX15_Mlig016694g2, partial [Macrostomum lignano]
DWPSIRRLLFYPAVTKSLTWRLLGLSDWYNRIDEHLVLGALPLAREFQSVAKSESIKAVLSINEPHEVKPAWVVGEKECRRLGLARMQLSVPDFGGHSPSARQLQKCCDFIESTVVKGGSVYLHCRAGRTRSGTVAAAYLMRRHRSLAPVDACDRLRAKRPSLLLNRPQLDALHEFWRLEQARER